MLESLSRNGMLIETLFHVQGDLVENYNRALEAAVGKRTSQTSFYIDQRGESRELEEELGENYLQSGPAHRYCIVVSPDQKNADLLHEEFSFDGELLAMLYQQYLSGISLATRVDGMYGELDDGVRAYETLEDLLLIERVHLELHTPSKFLSKARELQGYVKQLQTNPDLLLENESALPKKILQLVGQVGDIREYDLRPIQTSKSFSSFYTRLFGGVAIFRNVESQNPLQVTRPDQEHFLLDLTGDPLTTLAPEDYGVIEPIRQKPLETKAKAAPSKTVVIYQQKDYQPEDGPTVQFIPLQDKQRVIEFLVNYFYADYSADLIESRLARIEDETLLSKGHDVVTMNKQQQIQVLQQYQDAMLFAWYEIKELQRRLTKGHSLRDIIPEYSPETQSMLLVPMTSDPSTAEVVEHVLTRLYDFDYEKMFLHNRRHLEHLHLRSDANKQKYILHVLAKIE
ncbi:hypothetical protein U27_04427 [Candidatus Vecturithrix granuli]|uniref:Uncharacterized protein n=1 Tax=Vecturithrix granuli TaxID=1499967 RepID=A0A081BYQ5_VECG1|nr:hypothetical protein U27_04427 [Candidatus Vecturithrix granuli]